MTPTYRRLVYYFLAASALQIVPQRASAELISYEPFAYAGDGDLIGGSGGQGWSGVWIAGGFNASGGTNFDRAPGSLDSQPLLTAGNRVTTLAQNSITGVQRNFQQSIGAGDTVTRYLSVLLRPEGALGIGQFNGFFGLYLDGNGATGDDLFIGKGGGGDLNHWVVETRGGSGQVASAAAPVVNQTALLVLKAQFTPGNEIFTLYVDPVPGQPEPTSGIVKNDLNIGNVSGVVLYSTGGFSADEIRWGQTYADVTPIPEPSSWLLATVAALAIALAGRRGCHFVSRSA